MERNLGQYLLQSLRFKKSIADLRKERHKSLSSSSDKEQLKASCGRLTSPNGQLLSPGLSLTARSVGVPQCKLVSPLECARLPVPLQRPITKQPLPGLPGLWLPGPSWPWHSLCWPAWPHTAAAAAANSFMFWWLPRLPSRAVTNHSFSKMC